MTAAARPEPAPQRPERILVVDDSRDNLEIIATRLRFHGYQVIEAVRGEEALEKAKESEPDLILLDVMLPDIDGYEIARRIKTDDSLPFVPIILVTARDTTQDKVTGLNAGADDYLTKPINFPELEARVRSMLRIKALQDQLETKNQKLEQLSISDGLTGLFNHRHILDLLHEEFERANRTSESLTVVMFDLDRFKEINDTYGHQAGDRVLRETAEILRGTAREIDKLGRYGGEEFLAILPDTGLDDGIVFAERVRRRLADHTFEPPDGGERLELTMSAGVTSYPRPAIEDPTTLVEHADRALYEAKTSGRNRVVPFERLDEHESDEH